MRVGVLTASISRRAGGFFWSVRALTRGVQALGCDVQVFAGADPHTETDLGHWAGIPLSFWGIRGPSSFAYMPGLWGGLMDARLDVLHAHGLWMYPSVAAARWHRITDSPNVVSPRGMLDPWAVRNSAWKKRIAGWLYENAHLREAACIHALCMAEYEAIRAYGLRNPVAVIPNGVELPDMGTTLPEPAWTRSVPEGARILLFLGRLHPKKGLPQLLQAWSAGRRAQGAGGEPWRLVIAGWDQGGHREEMERLAATLGLADSVQFVGPQFEADKAASLARADAFVLPSFSEGLPMAVLEAWSWGLPVLMTPQCNLPEGFSVGAAIGVEPEVDAIFAGLETLFRMSSAERHAMGERGRELVRGQFTWPAIAAEMSSVYRWLLGQGERPACVIED